MVPPDLTVNTQGAFIICFTDEKTEIQSYELVSSGAGVRV